MLIHKARVPRAVLLALLVPLLLAEDHLKFGQPSCGTPVLDKTFFIVCHDSDRKIPAWVGYALTKADVARDNADRDNLRFRPDPELPRGKRAELSDYAQTATNKYDKGHMAPAQDFARSMAAMKSTFILSNAVPQKHGVNAGLWKSLETAVRRLPKNRGTVWVVSGPVFAGGRAAKLIGPHKVAVPTHTYKVILCVHDNGGKEMFAFVLPNIDRPGGELADYAQSVRQVQDLTGLNFFSALPAAEERRLEAAVNELP